MTAPFDFSAANLDREFPVRKSLVYFNHAAVAPLPRRVSDAIVAHVENMRDRGAADWRRWYGGIERARRSAAGFLGADRSQIAFLPSTSWALNLVARSFEWKAGDNVVGDDMEFPSNDLPWKLLEKQGVEYRVARNRGGRVTLDDIAAKVDGRTRVVAVSWVAFHNGFVFPLDEIGEYCRVEGNPLRRGRDPGPGALPARRLEDEGRRARRRRPQVAARAGGLHRLLRQRSGARAAAPAFLGWWNIRGRGGRGASLD